MITQQLIDDLIAQIKTAAAPNSVSNIMVGNVMDFLNSGVKNHIIGLSAVSNRIDALLGRNASTAIDNFNEILKFLEGVLDSESLIGLLNSVKERIRIAEQIGITAQSLGAVATSTASQAKSYAEGALAQCSALGSSKMDNWHPLLNEVYFLHANYRWARVSFIADNQYYAGGYQEFETFDIDVKSLVAQYHSTGVQLFTIVRWVGVNPGVENPADWKAVRFNIIVNAVTMYVQLNTPSSNTFDFKTYLMK